MPYYAGRNDLRQKRPDKRGIMERIFGKGISSGLAIGKIHIGEKKKTYVSPKPIDNIQAEWDRFLYARELVKEQMDRLRERVATKSGDEEAAIFEAHQMLLYDAGYTDSIEYIIKTKNMCAEYAVFQTEEIIFNRFMEVKDSDIAERAYDIKDISEQLIRALSLSDNGNQNPQIDEPVILALADVSPSEMARFDRSKILGIISETGGKNSHMAILARTMGIPVISGVRIDQSWDCKNAVIDADEGVVIINPDEDTVALVKEKIEKFLVSNNKNLDEGTDVMICKESGTLVYANISDEKDIESALECKAEGIGLFRSEYLFIGKDTFPSEEEQYITYKNISDKFLGRTVRIRTLDIGSEKQLPYFKMEKEHNSALGLRGIRASLRMEEIFKTQIKALLRANSNGNISMLVPMVISANEIQKVKKIYEDCRNELKLQGITVNDLEIGVMIETPAAAMISDELAKEVNFFSIGTNDLSQYTLAIDRQNSNLDSYFDPHHEAILRLIKMTIDNGHNAGISVGICGELAADLSIVKTLADMGIDELSVSPHSVMDVKEIILR